ncbi:sterol desaturase family protein [Paraburkholderia tropica]|uniref:sterol desaturase family protein n=1 Tax=Paraburkholderia tropica TaxID=92647 RepID=UPI002AB6E54C|nr:sterol desaturase family protein [Paraburkholderia tropica]
MDDLQFGKRNKRGDWAPNTPLDSAPLWTWPPSVSRVAGWIKGYIWPWNLFFALTAALWWNFVLPGMSAMRVLDWTWTIRLLVANWVGIFLFYGAFELRYYVLRTQENRFKYNGKFPSEQPSDVFWFKNQNIDNFIRSFFISVPIGTAIEIFILWSFSNGFVLHVSWVDHPVYLACLILLAPALHEVHFFAIHRILHWSPLYRFVHSVHHNSTNPSPWSSMSMHPVESTLYFGVALWCLVIPSHPFIAVYLIHIAGFGAIVGHIGFDQLKITDRSAMSSHAYAHYLHHRYFEVNYSDNGTFPLDQLFGSWHDGSPEGDRLMRERFEKKKRRLNAT